MTGIDFLALVIDCLRGPSKRVKINLIKYVNTLSDLEVKCRKDAEKITEGLFCISSEEICRASNEADSLSEECRAKGIEIVSFYNPAYPPLLREIYDPPSVLYVRGVLPDCEIPSAAVVGTRNAVRKTLSAAYDAAKYLAENKTAVVSGLAAGIDSMAHRGSLDGRGITAAVLGSGPDIIYPAANTGLAERILSENGSLISEYRPGTPPERFHFPERNRIISGISRGTLLVHAPEKSGSLITASFALDQGRDVFIHSEGLYSSGGKGGLLLCESGAVCVESGEDILREWNMDKRKRLKTASYMLNGKYFNVSDNGFSRFNIYNNGLYYRRMIYA